MRKLNRFTGGEVKTLGFGADTSFSFPLMSVENSEKAHCFLDAYHGFTLERNRAKAVERN